MKKISLGVVAILLAGATVFANDTVTKIPAKKVKPECQGRCQKIYKTGSCTSKDACSDMKTCGATCS
jgi:hypothetical protein